METYKKHKITITTMFLTELKDKTLLSHLYEKG